MRLNVPLLLMAYLKSDTIRGICAFLECEEPRLVSTVDSTYQELNTYGGKITTVEVANALRAMAQAGCGLYYPGTEYLPSRIEWLVPTHEIESLVKQAEAPYNYAYPELQDDINIEHRFLLRPGLVIEISLPEYITAEEARRLSTFLSLTYLGRYMRGPGSRRHTFWLRPWLEVEITLPINITETETERLGMFVTSIPFSDDEFPRNSHLYSAIPERD